jgi:hypothetical protein
LYREQLGQLTFQRADAVTGVLRDVIDCDPPWDKAAVALGGIHAEEWSDDVKEYLDRYVERRNRIVHGGDLKPGETSAQGIQLRYVELGVEIVKAVGNVTAAVIDPRVRVA